MPPDRSMTDLLRGFDPEWLPPQLQVDRVRGAVGAGASEELAGHLEDLLQCYSAARSTLRDQAARMLGGDPARAEEAVVAAVRAVCRATPSDRAPAWRALALALDLEIARRRDPPP